MRFLATERATLERYLPGLDERLAEADLRTLERAGNPALPWFREATGPRLVIPRADGGHGASLLDAVRVQRAVGSRSPSLAVATTMHHFSVASIVELSAVGTGLEWAMLQAISGKDWLLSSGFAEGRTGAHILSPVMKAIPVEGGLLVSGTKKPCSLTWSMDLMSASVSVARPDGGADRLAVVLLPATSEGIERHPFWASDILAGAESDEVVLSDVHVPDALVFYPGASTDMTAVQARGFLWFELLVTASYLGVCSGLVERVLTSQRGDAAARMRLVGEVEAAMAALECAAQPSGDDDADLARALMARYHVEEVIAEVSAAAVALAGGIAFVSDWAPGYLLAACRPLAFHPPSKHAAAEPLSRYFAGQSLVL
jgi:alkylation response protein AidB-like acyl-CoA dehydrogenase